MKRETFNHWFEKSSAVQTALKKVSLYHYSSPEQCQNAILQKLSGQPERAAIIYETDKRETEIKAILLYLPFVFIITISSFYILLSLFSSNPNVLKAGILQILTLLIVYRLTIFDQYLSTRKSLVYAKEKLMELIQVKPVTLPAAKGVISLILLQELIKKECKRPNLFQGDIQKNMDYYAYISGCNKKNMSDKVNHYIKRENMAVESENAKTTHLKYLSMISEYFKGTGDEELYLKAEELKVYVSHLPISK